MNYKRSRSFVSFLLTFLLIFNLYGDFSLATEGELSPVPSTVEVPAPVDAIISDASSINVDETVFPVSETSRIESTGDPASESSMEDATSFA